VTVHGRDQLHANWPDLYKPDEEATLPAEELVLLKPQGDYGWPECYYDPFREKRVLAPEYGGDGGKTIGVCANKIPPVAVYPAHWAPNAMVLYDKKQFAAHYHGIGRPMRRVVITSFFSRSPGTMPRGNAKYLRTVSQERWSRRAKPNIVPRARLRMI
jgi:hypothetical protein